MKVKVIKGFIDKNTKKPYGTGDELECSEKRFSELHGFVEIIKADNTKIKKEQ